MNHLRSVFGIVFVLIMIAGFTSLSFAEYASPRIQLESGVLPEDIQCRDDRILVIRTNSSPACVTERTAEKTGWEIINTFEIPATKQTPLVVELNVSSPVEFVDDGRDIQRSTLQKSPAPSPMYDRIMESMNDGISVNNDGIATITSLPHEKYSINPGVGFYAEDWLPSFIPDGQKLLYTGTKCYPDGSCLLGITFVPTTFVLNQGVTTYSLQVSKGFGIGVEYTPNGVDEVEDKIEKIKDIIESQPDNYGGFREMSRDGKMVLAYEGGSKLNHYASVLSFNPDNFTTVHINSNYHTLDELVPIFESIMN